MNTYDLTIKFDETGDVKIFKYHANDIWKAFYNSTLWGNTVSKVERCKDFLGNEILVIIYDNKDKGTLELSI